MFKNDLGNSGEVEERAQNSFSRRLLIAAIAVFIGFGTLIARMFYLQIIRYDYYRTRSQNNRIRVKAIPPERGIIYDRKGRALAENILRYRVAIQATQTKNVKATVEALQLYLNLNQDEINQFFKNYRSVRRYESAIIKNSITEHEKYRLAVHLYRLPGVVIESYYERYYPYGSLLAHVVGYTNRISEKDDLDNEIYRGIDNIGRTGLEKQYEERLRGKSGFQQVETDANGNLVRVLRESDAIRGQDIYLSIDIELQQFISKSFGEYRGSCVAIEPSSGEVLAMVSQPSFDANLFTRGISSKQYKRLLADEDTPLFNRSLKGRYPPGSVIKPVMNLAAFHYGVMNSHNHVFCSGHYVIPDSKSKRRFHCWNRHGHGLVNADKALVQSCDIYYYTVGYQLGIDKLAKFCDYFCIGRKTGIDLPEESSGLMPNREWKEKRYKSAWFIGDTINVSIGQGFMVTTPLQLAYISALFARDGYDFEPRLLKMIYDPAKQKFISPESNQKGRLEIYNSQTWNEVKISMERVIHSPIGTAKKIAQGMKYRMAGKSGTVQVISFQQNERIPNKDLKAEHQDNAMFISYAPAKNSKIALSVVIERGGSGGATAAPLIREITDYYLERKTS